MLWVRDFHRGRPWKFWLQHFTLTPPLCCHLKSFWTFKTFNQSYLLTYRSQWISTKPETAPSEVQRPPTITTKTPQIVSSSFPSFWTSIITFLLAGGGVMRFPHFQEGPFQKEQRQLWSSLLVSLLGSKGVLECGWEHARLWAAARWASELPVNYVMPRVVRMRREGTASLRTGGSLLWRVALEMERDWDEMMKWRWNDETEVWLEEAGSVGCMVTL